MQLQWSYCNQSPSGRLLGVEPDYLPCFRCLVSVMFGPHSPMGGWRGAWPPTTATMGSRGGGNYCPSPPLGGGSGAVPSKGIFYEKLLVKYCHFVVNLGHSLYHRYYGRSYINLRVFFPRRKPSIIYEGIVLRLCIILREENVREWRGSYNRCAVGCIPSFFWIK